MKKSVLCIILCLSLLLSGVQASTVRAQDPPEDLSFPEYPQDIIKNHFEDLSHHMFNEEMPEDWHHHPHYEEPIEREFIPPTEESLRLTQEQVQSFDCATVTDVPQTECEALVALYERTNGAGWFTRTNWLTTTTVGDWYGVTVSKGHVKLLNFYRNNLTGIIPPQLKQLISLLVLQLDRNQLIGSIPPELGQLSTLTSLSIIGNQLSGGIPPELGQLSALEELELSENQLSGSIPKELGQLSALKRLSLYANQLSGNIPKELGQLSTLTLLSITGNQLSGDIPKELGQLSALEELGLSENQLNGSIPPELGQLSTLETLRLSSNQLSGSIPKELGQLSSLTWLWLSSNQLSGSIPKELGQLSALTSLKLEDNLLSGNIPSELGQLTNLIHLDLSHNNVEGDVPASFTNLVNLCVDGQPWSLCNGKYKTDLGYNLLNVPQPNPPSDFLFEKDPDWDQTQGVKEVISGPVGGMLNSNDGKTTVEIPKGAVNGDVTFILKPTPKPTGISAPYIPAGNNFELSAWDANGPVTTFNLPLNVTLRYTDAGLDVILEDTLKLYYYNESASAWQDAITTCSEGSYTYNPDQNWFSLPVCHLSDFSVVGEGILIHFPLILR